MITAARVTALCASLLVGAPLSGCGAERPPAAPPTADSEVGGVDIPVAKCLAIASAKAPRNPNEPEKITVSQVLVKYAGAKAAAPSVVRSREAACVRAYEASDRLQKGLPFADVVSMYSDEPAAASRQGKLGTIARRDVVEPFADVAFALAPGEVSRIVETAYGFHVILRTE